VELLSIEDKTKDDKSKDDKSKEEKKPDTEDKKENKK